MTQVSVSRGSGMDPLSRTKLNDESAVQSKGSKGQPEGQSEGQLQGSEGQTEGSDGQPEGSGDQPGGV